jgi:hypothetical protein
MTIPLRLKNRSEGQPAQAVRLRELPLPPPQATKPKGLLELSTAELAFRTLAAFRAHPHISNVLTHISHANWGNVERSLNSILDVTATGEALSPLEQNIVDLMVAERGIAGRILKPYFLAVLQSLIEHARAERLIRHVEALFLELEWKAQQPAPSISMPIEPSQEPGDARSERQ